MRGTQLQKNPSNESRDTVEKVFFSTSVFFMFFALCLVIWGRDSSVGIATRYGLDGPGIESR